MESVGLVVQWKDRVLDGPTVQTARWLNLANTVERLYTAAICEWACHPSELLLRDLVTKLLIEP